MDPRVIAITSLDVVPEAELFARLDAAAPLTADARARLAVQLRDPALSGRKLLELGRRLRVRTRELGLCLIMNDRVDLAVALAADGVHLGRRSVSVEDARALLGPAAWVSVSAHSVAEVAAAAERGASAVLLSPVFASPGKAAPLGLEAIREARRLLDASWGRLRLVALGGLDVERARAALDAGADAVAGIRHDLVRAELLR